METTYKENTRNTETDWDYVPTDSEDTCDEEWWSDDESDQSDMDECCAVNHHLMGDWGFKAVMSLLPERAILEFLLGTIATIIVWEICIIGWSPVLYSYWLRGLNY